MEANVQLIGTEVPVKFEIDEMQLDFNLDVESRTFPFEADVGTVVFGNVDDYNGTYEVIPRNDDQLLQTRNKRLTNDVTIRRVPSHIIPNGFGETFTIGD